MKSEETTLDKIRSRPRFKLYTTLSKEKIVKDIQKSLRAMPKDFTGNINSEVATIQVKTDENPFWKPNLSLRIENEDDKTVIRGIFGPNTSIWTFFMFLYFVFSILWMTFFTMFFVEKQINSNDFPWALSASFFMLACIAATYFASRFGQKKAKSEMDKLRDFAEKVLLYFEQREL
jgi:magnesium-transporting ATPase (P-type)